MQRKVVLFVLLTLLIVGCKPNRSSLVSPSDAPIDTAIIPPFPSTDDQPSSCTQTTDRKQTSNEPHSATGAIQSAIRELIDEHRASSKSLVHDVAIPDTK